MPIRLEIVPKRYVALSSVFLEHKGPRLTAPSRFPHCELLSVRNWGKHPASKSVGNKKKAMLAQTPGFQYITHDKQTDFKPGICLKCMHFQ